MEVMVENDGAMCGSDIVRPDVRLSAAPVIGSKSISYLENHEGGMHSPLVHENGPVAIHGEARQVSFRDVIMGGVANGLQNSDLDVLETLERPTRPIPLGSEGGSVYGPWMQAQGRKRRPMLSRTPAATSVSIPPKGVLGSRYNMLNLDDDSADITADASASQLRDLVISAGPIATAKGKATGQTGVGSSKGNGLKIGRGSGEVHSSLEALKNLPSGDPRVVLDVEVGANKEKAAINLPNQETSVVVKGSVIRMSFSLNRRSHMAVHIDEEDLRSVSKDIGDRSMSGPIRSNGAKSVNRMAASAKSIYRQGPRLHRKEIKKGPDKPTLGDWLPFSLNKIGGTGDVDNGRPLEGDPFTGVKPAEHVSEVTKEVSRMD
ncbi:hypothetical protein V6N12_066418 [Hibiscus sabdariffa]|uniref:Erect panicle 2 protein n=1 Tax=Hibiscus sabdariffa TaxID=183260 RepID=A0ABR2CQ16_9ROSI